MADTLTRQRPASPAGVERALSALWSEVGREGALTRALMANLVVVSTIRPDQPIDEAADRALVDEVSMKHPSRVIRLLHVPNEHLACGPDKCVAHVLTWGPAGARYGVEQIVVRAPCASASLPSIVRGLVLGSLPTIVWWADDLSRSSPLHEVMAMGRQLLFDSRQWRSARDGARVAMSVLNRTPHLDLCDVNWRRLLRLRQVLVAAVSNAASAPPKRWRLRHRQGESVLAYLAGAWLTARGLASFAELDIKPRDDNGGDDVLTVSSEGGGIAARMNDSSVEAAYRPTGAPLVLAARRETPSDAIAAELKDLGRDVCLHDSLQVLAHLTAPGFSG
jgi:glucose-6-phosphate dehydrogenase assembly protein OpcA